MLNLRPILLVFDLSQPRTSGSRRRRRKPPQPLQLLSLVLAPGVVRSKVVREIPAPKLGFREPPGMPDPSGPGGPCGPGSRQASPWQHSWGMTRLQDLGREFPGNPMDVPHMGDPEDHQEFLGGHAGCSM